MTLTFPSSLSALTSETRTSTFVGCMYPSDFGDVLSRCGSTLTPAAATGNSGAFLAGRAAHSLNLPGACVAVDTACSSSLVAAHLAATAVRGDENSSSSSLVAGVNGVLSPTTAAAVCALGAAAPDGRCKTLDSAADGYGRGEGFVAAVLAPSCSSSSSSFSFSATPLALLAGSALGHDGARAALAAPSGPAQAAVVRTALASVGGNGRSGCQGGGGALPSSVATVSLHGTGTALGDPLELGALASALRVTMENKRPFPPPHPLSLASSKAAAGTPRARQASSGSSRPRPRLLLEGAGAAAWRSCICARSTRTSPTRSKG